MHNNIWKDGLSQPCGDQQPPSAIKKVPSEPCALDTHQIANLDGLQ